MVSKPKIATFDLPNYRLYEYRTFYGQPELHSRQKVSNTIAKSNGLKTDPWWPTTVTSNLSPKEPLTLTLEFAQSY